MEQTCQDPNAATKPDQATEEEKAERSSRGVGGGAAAEEEDIGTEGAGTEPPTSVDAGPASAAPR
jgi:hypothetical protein